MTKFLYLANLRLPTEKAYGIQITKMCQAFANSGIDVDLIFPKRRNPFSQDIFAFYGLKSNFSVFELFAPDFYWSGVFDRLAFYIKSFISAIILCWFALKHDYNIIFSRDEFPVFLLSFFQRGLVYEAHRFSIKKRFVYKYFSWAGIKVITISQGIKEEFIKLGFQEKHILVAADAVDFDEFNIRVTKEDARRKLSLPFDASLIMYTGQLFIQKGVRVLAETADLLPDAYFVFVGGTEVGITDFKKDYGDKKNILVMGWKKHEEIPLFLKASDILVIPNDKINKISSVYTSPLKLFEYMASGRPIIASDIPAVREVLHEDSALLIDASSPQAIAEGIKLLTTDPDLSARISRKALEDVQKYSWLHRARVILNFISAK